ncbi:hypothetical protein BDQ12DRAFT_732070 [Crucibulum laeve]|uniref:Small ribosomal subunit protein uS13m n=1 Tax=Crucibulum laeve TaxID=68775 RepID=A0A5C3MEY2_9AGAR|nr:hypothetical protein BDQ12DRAFT_732070 [Crucibulum laeve]
MHILGVNLPDSHLARFALTNFYGIGHKTAHRLCARLQVHDKCKVKDLSPFQVTALASFLSSPATSPTLPRYPLATPDYVPPSPNTPAQELQARFAAIRAKRVENRARRGTDPIVYKDTLKDIKVESELRREIRENIAHQRMIGSYVGRRHAMHLPVRGQNTQSNAKTARKLNQMDRY